MAQAGSAGTQAMTRLIPSNTLPLLWVFKGGGLLQAQPQAMPK
ncbi:MAG: hypothetical protein WCS42_21990 [Verrucomicrobiota bacterium]